MRFLLTPDVSPAAATALREHGHVATDFAEAGIAHDVTGRQLLAAAKTRQLEIVTSDRQLLEAMLPASGAGHVFGRLIVQLPDDVESHADAIAVLLARFKRLSHGRLYSVTGGGAKARQLPTTSASSSASPLPTDSSTG